MHQLRRRTAVLAAIPAAFVIAAPALAAPVVDTGPTTTVAPYVLPVADDVSITSLLTVADKPADNGYRMVGIPDGLGVFGGDGEATVFMNHELRSSQGLVRAHGQKGAFVSRLQIDTETLGVKAGADLIQPGTEYWNYRAGEYAAAPVAPVGAAVGTHTPAFSRFCSGALTDKGQLYSKTVKAGYKGRLYFANEESGDEGRVFGVTEAGRAYQLPRLGLFSWENTLAARNETATTLVMGNEDTTAGQIWAYVGSKQNAGSPVDMAGLTNGVNSVIAIKDGVTKTDAQFRAAYPKGTAAPVSLTEVNWNQSGAAQNAEAITKGGLSLNRIEDGSFDPSNPGDYYFLTTEGSPDPSRGRDGGGLWRLRFKDVEKPALGGTLELLLNGTEAPFLNKPDNMTIDESGNLLIQEDPGNNPHVARILAYQIGTAAIGVVAQFDTAQFGDPAATGFLTQDEESSGIVGTHKQFGKGTFLFDAQVHTAKGLPVGSGPGTVEEYVERGQLLLLRVKDWAAVYGNERNHGKGSKDDDLD